MIRATTRGTAVRVSAIVAAMAVLAGCSSPSAPEAEPATASAARQAEPVAALGSAEKGFPGNTFEVLDKIMQGTEIFDGLLSCSTEAGCFGDETQTEVLKQLAEISKQLAEVKAEVTAGIAATRVDISAGAYAEAETAYKSTYGTAIEQASASLATITNPQATLDDREYELESFKLEAKQLMPGTPQSSLSGFFTRIAGSGEELTQGGLLGSAWRLIIAKERERQGDAKGNVPAYLPSSSINLMSHMGEQRIVEGSQLVTILLAYSVIANPTFYAKPAMQKRLTTDLQAIWRNGGKTSSAGVKPVQPGAAAVVAALPRAVPSQSGVFTAGLGIDKNEGLLVRNFSPTVDTATRIGPIVNADAGYALAPGQDKWLSYSSREGQPRREMALSRSGVNWNFDSSSGALTATVPPPSWAVDADGGFLTPIVEANPKVGSVVGYAQVGSATAAAWVPDPATGRIALKSNPQLCMAVGGRADTFWNFNNNWVRGLDAVGWLYPDGTYQEWATIGMLPRISLKTCAPNQPAQQWFLDGPVPADGLPWTNPQALISLSPPVDHMGDYPAADWKPLSTENVNQVFEYLESRGIKDRLLFDLYGSPTSPAQSRALPPVLHPVVWTTSKRIFDAGANEWPKYENSKFDMTAVAFPSVDEAGKSSFTIRPLDGKGALDAGWEKTTKPWISTAAILGQEAAPCGFLFETPSNSYTCAVKQATLDTWLSKTTSLSADSPVLAVPAPESASPSESAMPSVSASPSESSSASVTAEPSAESSPVSSGAPSGAASTEPTGQSASP